MEVCDYYNIPIAPKRGRGLEPKTVHTRNEKKKKKKIILKKKIYLKKKF